MALLPGSRLFIMAETPDVIRHWSIPLNTALTPLPLRGPIYVYKHGNFLKIENWSEGFLSVALGLIESGT